MTSQMSDKMCKKTKHSGDVCDSLVLIQGSQIRQIWGILHQNCSDDSAEVTGESVRLQKFLVTNREPL